MAGKASALLTALIWGMGGSGGQEVRSSSLLLAWLCKNPMQWWLGRPTTVGPKDARERQ